MKYQKFIQKLPDLYVNWGNTLINPKSGQFSEVITQINAINIANIMQLLNWAIDCIEAEEIYCEVGCQASTLIGAMLNHSDNIAYAVNTFSEDDSERKLAEIYKNLSLFNLESQVFLCQQDSLEFCADLKNIDTEIKIGVYFDNELKDYKSQLLKLLLIKHFFAPQTLIIINNNKLATIQQAKEDFLKGHPQCKLLLKLPIDEENTFGNGIDIFAWDINQKSADNCSDLTIRAEAIQVYQEYLQLYPADVNILAHLGKAFTTQNNEFQATIYLGYAAYYQHEYQQTISQFEKLLSNHIICGIHLYITLGECYQKTHQYEQEIIAYREGIKHYPHERELYLLLIISLQNFGMIEEAITVYNQSLQFFPNDLRLQLQNQKLLPIIYETSEEIDFYRHRFSQTLDVIIEQTSLNKHESRINALEAIGLSTNFYLHYQGKNDVDLQSRYGNFVTKIMAANYPQWHQYLPMPPLNKNDKIRIGYISSRMYDHPAGKIFIGWLNNHNQEQFEVYSYYIAEIIDDITTQFQLNSHNFHHIPNNLEAVCKQIISDQLHLLIFIDIGIHPLITQIAALRNAPIQCMTWGHPITSGIPTIDYFISNQLMEVENAQAHYSEKLIKLSNLGIFYPQPSIPLIAKERSYFQLSDQSIVYLCCQYFEKYLPEHDHIYPAIAAQINNAKFVFIKSTKSDYILNKFQQRLQNAFAKFGLHSQDYCLILPRLKYIDYLHIMLVSDIFLDTFKWSGGGTTIEAIACNLPVVTCAGELMRSRQSYGMLKMLGVTETIAKNEAEYIEIAVKLAIDTETRARIKKKIMQNHSRIYNDQTSIIALEEFYQSVVTSRWQNN